MTRIFKVSLSIVALLLVSLLVFTGCSKKTADEAFTAAEEAKEAVVAATADFEKAIAEKADTNTLTAEVDKLVKAIENAEFAATDGDAALKSAIATAKAALTENTQAVVNAFDVKIAELLNKVEESEVDTKLAEFKKTLDDINSAVGSCITVADFNSVTSLAAEYAYSLEKQFERMVTIESIYGDEQWEKIEKAYIVAKVSIYRATSMAAIESALADFKNAIKDNQSNIDEVYIRLCDTKTGTAAGDYDTAKQYFLNCNNAPADMVEPARAVMKNYYYNCVIDGKDYGNNLLLAALEIWRTEIEADILEISEASAPAEDFDAKIASINTAIETFNAQAEICRGWFGAASAKNLDTTAYVSNVARLAAMKADAEALVSLRNVYLGADDAAKEAAFTAWENAYNNWVTNYMTFAQGKDVVEIEDYLADFDVEPAK